MRSMLDSHGWLRRRVVFVAMMMSLATAADARAFDPEALERAASDAAGWLESVQSADGSWGSAPAVRAIHTGAAVEALAALGWRRGPYHDGVSWLSGHAMPTLDHRVRRVLSLAPDLRSLDEDLAFIDAAFSTGHFAGGGWGLASPYLASAFDTSLAIRTEIAREMPDPARLRSAIDFLTAMQDADGCWGTAALGGEGACDVTTTAEVLNALAAVANEYPEVVEVGDAAAAWLASTGASGASTLTLATALRSRIAWDAQDGSIDPPLSLLLERQQTNGSWGDDTLATSVAVHALAMKLRRHEADLHASIPIADLGLRAAINASLGKNRLDAVRRIEMLGLRDLDASRFVIRDLSGIEEAVHLTSIDLSSSTGLEDLTPLDPLPSLVSIVGPEAPCDVDGDSALTVVDTWLTMRAHSGERPLSATELRRVDLAPPGRDGDGKIDVRDVLLMLRAQSGLGAACSNRRRSQ